MSDTSKFNIFWDAYIFYIKEALFKENKTGLQHVSRTVEQILGFFTKDLLYHFLNVGTRCYKVMQHFG